MMQYEYSELLNEFGCIIFFLNLYVRENMYTLVDKIMRAHSSEEVTTAFSELLRDAQGRRSEEGSAFRKALPSATEVARFYSLVAKDITVAHVIGGLAYTFLGKNFFNKYCKKATELEEEIDEME